MFMPKLTLLITSIFVSLMIFEVVEVVEVGNGVKDVKREVEGIREFWIEERSNNGFLVVMGMKNFGTELWVDLGLGVGAKFGVIKFSLIPLKTSSEFSNFIDSVGVKKSKGVVSWPKFGNAVVWGLKLGKAVVWGLKKGNSVSNPKNGSDGKVTGWKFDGWTKNIDF